MALLFAGHSNIFLKYTERDKLISNAKEGEKVVFALLPTNSERLFTFEKKTFFKKSCSIFKDLWFQKAIFTLFLQTLVESGGFFQSFG